jgi:hypothetical protein
MALGSSTSARLSVLTFGEQQKQESSLSPSRFLGRFPGQADTRTGPDPPQLFGSWIAVAMAHEFVPLHSTTTAHVATWSAQAHALTVPHTPSPFKAVAPVATLNERALSPREIKRGQLRSCEITRGRGRGQGAASPTTRSAPWCRHNITYHGADARGQVKSLYSWLKSNQVQVRSGQVKPDQIQSTQLDSSQVKSSEVM